MDNLTWDLMNLTNRGKEKTIFSSSIYEIIREKSSEGGVWNLKEPLYFTGNEVIFKSKCTIEGDLTVEGKTLQTNLEQVYVNDPLYILNVDNTGQALQDSKFAGIEVRVSGSAENDAMFLFDIEQKDWKLNYGNNNNLYPIATMEKYNSGSLHIDNIIMSSPNGQKFKIQISDEGMITSVPI